MPGPARLTPSSGLCPVCRHVRLIRSGRGSEFLMCERGLRKETGFTKYPRLPVLACGGYEPPSEPDPRD